MKFQSIYKYIPVLFIIFLAACDGGQSHQQALAAAQSLTPTDPIVAEIYQRSCRNCHTVAATGAPLTGDKSKWADLIAESGKAGLVENVINGKGGMPPFGLCMECGIDDFSMLIEFMAQQQ